MAGAIETQRLISVSLGKIAQSRGQRGGINLHKNLLVATVLHKARTAYMMENYNYQLSLQRHKQQEEQQQIQQENTTPSCMATSAASPVSSHEPRGECSMEELCQTPQEATKCQAAPDVESRSHMDSPAVSEPDCEATNAQEMHTLTQNKENISPSSSTTESTVSDRLDCKPVQPSTCESHLEAANLLSATVSQEVQHASSCNSHSSKALLSSSIPCGTSVLKRRRDNPEACLTQELECTVTKKARISSDLSVSYVNSDDSDSDCELDMQTSDSPQISNLVTIFNSGFSGLCVTSSSPQHSSYDSSFMPLSNDTSLSQQWQTTQPISRNITDSSLHCSSQVERLGSLSSAIVLSA